MNENLNETPEYLVAKMDFSKLAFLRDPYPIGLATKVFHDIPYRAMIEGFPPIDLLKHWGGKEYNKYVLNERMSIEFHEYISEHPIWWAFHNSIKKPEFPEFIFFILKSHGIEIAPNPDGWTTRFEFSAMPAEGGWIVPHTDIYSKAVTLIFSILGPGEWNPSWGGGTDVLVPKDPTAQYKDYKAPLELFDRVETFNYKPNQCIIFIKTENSWHSVGPIQGPAGKWRRTLTLNIERADKAKEWKFRPNK